MISTAPLRISISPMKPDFMRSKLLGLNTNKISSLYRREYFQPRLVLLKNLKVARGKLLRVRRQVQAPTLKRRPMIRHNEEGSVLINPLRRGSLLLTVSLHHTNLCLVSASTKRSTAETSCVAAKLSQLRTLLRELNN